VALNSRIIRPRNGSPSTTSVLVLVAVVNTKAFSFHNRSSSNFAYTLQCSPELYHVGFSGYILLS